MNRKCPMATVAAALCLALWPAVVRGEGGVPLTLKGAVSRALVASPEVLAAAAVAEQGIAGSDEARSALLPRLDLAESWLRGDNPVFVFGTRLEQGRFGEQDFALDRLNHPDPITNHQTSVRAQWDFFDPARLAGLRAAIAGRSQATERRRGAEQMAIAETLRAYFAVGLAERTRLAVERAIAAAASDLERASARRDAGLVHEADVLALRVHRAALEERLIRSTSAALISMAELNRAMGEPLDREWDLMTPLQAPGGEGGTSADEAEALARAASPQAAAMRDAVRIASEERARARSGFLPAIGSFASWELDRQSMFGPGEDSWTVGVAARINLFAGFGDRARLAGATAAERRVRAEAVRTDADLALAARRAVVERDAARARIRVTEVAAEQARESRRIVSVRFSAGLAPVGDLLRADSAVIEAELHQLEAAFAARLALAGLALATGTLGPESEALEP